MFNTGVELVTGIPGAGKSFFLVERLLDWILIDKRPVYTNLPLRHRVLKEYLKNSAGPEHAGLIYDLKEENFQRFIEGFGSRQKFIEDALTKGTSRTHAIKKWEKSNTGFENWWIPAGSVIIIDEAHHWYPNPALSNVRKKEPPELMTFLTMHRHGQYLINFATQAERQISTTIKSLCSTRFIVQRFDREPLALGISLEFLGFPILRYEKYQGESDPEKSKPLETFTRFPLLPWHQKIFRFYESFTHAGGKYEADNSVKEKRKIAGIKEKSKVPKKNYTKRITKWFTSKTIKIIILIVICNFFYKCGKGEAVAVDPAKQIVTFEIIGISPVRVYTNSGEARVGDQINNLTLHFIDPSGTTFWRTNDDQIYIGNLGDTVYPWMQSESVTTTGLDNKPSNINTNEEGK